MSYAKMMKWQKTHRKGTTQPVIMHTNSGFTPSKSFLDSYFEYRTRCERAEITPLECEEYYHANWNLINWNLMDILQAKGLPYENKQPEPERKQTFVVSVPYLFEPGQQQILSDMAEHGMQAAFTAQGPDGQIILHRSGQPVPEGCTMLRRYRLPQEQAPQPSLF